MPFGNFARDQMLLTQFGRYLLVGGPIDPDVKHVTEICAWIVQGLPNGNDAAATEMAGLTQDQAGTPLTQSDLAKLLLFKYPEGQERPADEGSLETAWHLLGTSRGDLRLVKTVASGNGGGPIQQTLETVDATAPDPIEWRMLIARKGGARTSVYRSEPDS